MIISIHVLPDGHVNTTTDIRPTAGMSGVDALIVTDAYSSFCSLRIKGADKIEHEEIPCMMVTPAPAWGHGWVAKIPDSIFEYPGTVEYQVVSTNINGDTSVSERGTLTVGFGVQIQKPANVGEFEQYTTNQLYSLLAGLTASYNYLLANATGEGGGGVIGGGGALPLEGETIIIFGDDYEKYNAMTAELERMTGARVINLAINGTCASYSASDDNLKRYFSFPMLTDKYSYFTGHWNAIDDAELQGVDVSRYTEVLEQVEQLFDDGRVQNPIVIISYGKSDFFKNAPLENASSQFDVSTFKGGILQGRSNVTMNWYNQRPPILMNTPTSKRKEAFAGAKSWVNDNGVSFMDYQNALKTIASDSEMLYIDIFDNVGISADLNYFYSLTFDHFNDEGGIPYAFLTEPAQKMVAHRIAQILT